jgi:hypothetical protein
MGDVADRSRCSPFSQHAPRSMDFQYDCLCCCVVRPRWVATVAHGGVLGRGRWGTESIVLPLPGRRPLRRLERDLERDAVWSGVSTRVLAVCVMNQTPGGPMCTPSVCCSSTPPPPPPPPRPHLLSPIRTGVPSLWCGLAYPGGECDTGFFSGPEGCMACPASSPTRFAGLAYLLGGAGCLLLTSLALVCAVTWHRLGRVSPRPALQQAVSGAVLVHCFVIGASFGARTGIGLPLPSPPLPSPCSWNSPCGRPPCGSPWLSLACRAGWVGPCDACTTCCGPPCWTPKRSSTPLAPPWTTIPSQCTLQCAVWPWPLPWGWGWVLRSTPLPAVDCGAFPSQGAKKDTWTA